MRRPARVGELAQSFRFEEFEPVRGVRRVPEAGICDVGSARPIASPSELAAPRRHDEQQTIGGEQLRVLGEA